MKTRGLCLLTAAVLLLLCLPFAPAYACDFCDDFPDPDSLDLVGYVAPTEDTPGYSGDYYCPYCKALVIPGSDIEPKHPESDNPYFHGPDSDPEDKPIIPVTPADPNDPEDSDTPVQPELPVVPAQPNTPAEPEQPVIPGESAGAVDAAPGQPVTPPQEEKKPAQDPSAQENPETQITVIDSPAQAGDQPQSAPQGNSAGGGAKQKKAWKPFSKRFPYRRVRMNPQPGIRAEAAGILIWPVVISPFMSMFSE